MVGLPKEKCKPRKEKINKKLKMAGVRQPKEGKSLWRDASQWSLKVNHLDPTYTPLLLYGLLS